jgi:CBS domain-containing protein
MNVSQILKQKGNRIVSMPEDAMVSEAAAVLAREGIGAVLVLDRSGRVAGIVSERDLVRCMAAHGAAAFNLTVTEVMTRNVVFCRPLDSIDRVMSEMTERRFRHLPVTDNGRLVGIVSIGDVVKYRLMETEAEAESLRQYIAAG